MEHESGITRVLRSKDRARRTYDAMSGIYDLVATPFERRVQDRALEMLAPAPGETVLEIGFGTGRCLARIARLVGEGGRVHGIDISPGMAVAARKRMDREGVSERVELVCGDGECLPCDDDMFDAVFMSFTLELFDTPGIPRVLAEVERVLGPAGRLVVAGISKGKGDSLLVSVYEWVHRHLQSLVDCRPMYVERSIREAGFSIHSTKSIRLFGFPCEVVEGMVES